MTAQDWLDRTQAITEKATGGAWEWVPSITAQSRYRPAKVSTLVWDGGDAVEATLPHSTADAEFIAHARTALPQAVAALRAVMGAHRVTEDFYEPYKFCVACSSRDRTVAWPCPTITTITETLQDGGPHVDTRPTAP